MTIMLLQRHHVPVTSRVVLLALAATVVLGQGPLLPSFSKSSRKPRLMPNDLSPLLTNEYKNKLEVEKLKAQILRGLNMTSVPEPPRQKPSRYAVTMLTRQSVVSNLGRSSSSIPDAVIWSEPVDTVEKTADQLLFRVSAQKDMSSVINRVSLILRLRSKKTDTDQDKDREDIVEDGAGDEDGAAAEEEEGESESGVAKGGKSSRRRSRKEDEALRLLQNEVETAGQSEPYAVGSGYQNDASRSTTTTTTTTTATAAATAPAVQDQEEKKKDVSPTQSKKKKKAKTQKSARSGKGGLSSSSSSEGAQKKAKAEKGKGKKWRRVKLLVQALNEQSGRFKRVAVQRFTVRKKFSWIKLPIPATLVSQAATSSNQTLVLRIRCKRCHKGRVSIDSALPRKHNVRRPAQPGGDGGERERDGEAGKVSYLSLNPNRPYLVIRTADEPLAADAPHRRYSRQVSSQCPERRASGCCAERVEVSFKALGWDSWIVHPAAFSTVLCRGTCIAASAEPPPPDPGSRPRPGSRPVGDDGALGLAVLSNGMGVKGLDSSLPAVGPSRSLACRPNRPGPLEVLTYATPNSLVRAVVPDLIGDSCDCTLT